MNQLQKNKASVIIGKARFGVMITLAALVVLAIIIITVVVVGGKDLPVSLLIIAGAFFAGDATGAVSTLKIGAKDLSAMVEDLDHLGIVTLWAHVTKVLILSGNINREMFKTLYDNAVKYFPAVEVDGKQKRDS